jgi:hypothetical protein
MNAQSKAKNVVSFAFFFPASPLFFPATTLDLDHQAGITGLCAFIVVRYAIGERIISSTVVSRTEINFIDLETKSKYRQERDFGSQESISRFLLERKWWYSWFDMVSSPGHREQGAQIKVYIKRTMFRTDLNA